MPSKKLTLKHVFGYCYLIVYFFKMASKGLSVELSTFEKYGKSYVIGSKTEEINGRVVVCFIWCKLCAKHKTAVLANPLCKGKARLAVEAYVSGTNFVSKWNIDCDLNGEYYTCSIILYYQNKVFLKLFSLLNSTIWSIAHV